MFKPFNRHEIRIIKHKRARKKIEGTPERPRLAVYRSLSHIYAQVIDDNSASTLLSVSSLQKDLVGEIKNGGNVASAKVVGKKVAELCKLKGIEAVVFDRGGFLYHGRVKALADAAREGGLKF